MVTERSIRRTSPTLRLNYPDRAHGAHPVCCHGCVDRAGSRHELPEVNGISHFVEHMVFKGTQSRSAKRIAREVDAIGGNLDAFTGKETICFNLKVLDEHVPTALDVLSDLVLNPVFNNDDIMRERGVILEEIKMDEDNPDYLVHEIFTQNFWKDHPLGKPILGTKETVRRFEQDILFDYYGKRFSGNNMVFSAAGNLEHDALSTWSHGASTTSRPATARWRRPSRAPFRRSCCATRRLWSRCSSAWACLLRRSRTICVT
jgi:predicted Zn-dependent peptidase